MRASTAFASSDLNQLTCFKVLQKCAWVLSTQCDNSSANKLSHKAALTWALSMICFNSAARNKGMVGTTTKPAFNAAKKQAAIMGLLPPRSNKRSPD